MVASMSGITVPDICLTAFDDIKKRRKHNFVVYGIENEAVIIKEQGKATSYETFTEKLSASEPSFVVYDFEYPSDGVTKSKLVFISWIPDGAPTRQKMIYASTKDSLKSKIEGGLVEVQATDASEIKYEEILARVKRF